MRKGLQSLIGIHSSPRRPTPSLSAISVELSEILPIDEAYATGEHAGLSASSIEDFYGGVDPIDGDCAVGKCVGLLTRDGSLELDSRYGCTPPYAGFCAVDFALSTDFVDKSILGGVRIGELQAP